MKIDETSYSIIIPFGKYKDKSFGYIAETNPSYLEWIINESNFPSNIKELATITLSGSPHKKIIPQNKKTVEMTYIGKDIISVSFPYDSELIERFKLAIDGRKYDSSTGWTFHRAQLIRAIKFFGVKNVKLDDKCKKICEEEHKKEKLLDEIRNKIKSDIEVNTKLPLYEYQKLDVEFGNILNGRFYIAHEVGGGKTGAAIGFAVKNNAKKILVIVPKSVKLQWATEIKRFTGKDSCLWNSDGHGNLNYSWHIINYDIVHDLRKQLYKIDYDLLICDEATHLKNYQSQRTKAILGYWKQRKTYPGFKTKWAIFLSGTPMPNRPIELFSILSYLDKNKFNNPKHFIERYSEGIYDRDKYKNLDELHERTKHLIIRRLQSETDGDRPAKERNDLYVELTKEEQKEYIKELNKLFDKWKLAGKPSAAQMPALRDLLFDYKFPRIIEFTDELVTANKSILIYTIQQEHAYKIKNYYGENAVVITGNETDEEREIAKQKLINKEVKIGVFTIGVGAMGIDGLQHSIQDVLFTDIWWVPYYHEQGEGRIYRKGQLEKTRAWYINIPGTIDEDMREVLKQKQEIINTVIDGKVLNNIMNKSIFKEVLYRLSNRMVLNIDNIDQIQD